jgi:hypothetical protein
MVNRRRWIIARKVTGRPRVRKAGEVKKRVKKIIEDIDLLYQAMNSNQPLK